MQHEPKPGSAWQIAPAAALAPAVALFPAPAAVATVTGVPPDCWLNVEHCPGCGSGSVRARQALRNTRYFFGDEQIDYPAAGIAVLTCADCDLVYKNVLPDPQFLAQVLRRQAGKKWMEPYDFSCDVNELKRVAAVAVSDVLDIGAGNGDLLKSCAAAGIAGRLSALDVLPHPGLERHLAGEFIQGFLDTDTLQWSGVPYQAVTLFDVLEHLYSPELAFENLRRLVKVGGWVLLETGNVHSEWPRRFGIAEWWYVHLFEHHIFWSRRSLEHIASRHGFEIVLLQERRHKSRRTSLTLHAAKDWLKACLYRSAHGVYANLATYLGKHTVQPWDPFTRDHIRVFLRKR